MERNAYRSSWPGFVPAIHVLASQTDRKDVDARHKAGHDETILAVRILQYR
jgi:hypothetical protein